MKLTIKQNPKPVGKVDAKNLGVGAMFTDRDGDLYVRAEGGVVSLTEGDGLPFAVYSDAELEDDKEFSFMFGCDLVKGDIKVKVTLT